MGSLIRSTDLTDLRYPYSITAVEDDDPRLRGEPDNALFNRHERYEVLRLLDKVADALGVSSKEDIHKLEYMIHNLLPGQLRSRLHVFQWLVQNFNRAG
jgi:hypothetical protein